MSKTLGFIGSGDVSERKTRALLNDALDAHEKVKAILPVTKATWHPRLETVAEWALKNECPIEVVTDDTTDALTRSRTIDKKLVNEVLDTASKTHKVAKVPNKLVNLLAAADGDLWVFYDEEDEDGYTAFEKAWEVEVPTFDACQGLDQMRLEDEEPEGDAEEDPDADEPIDPVPDDEDGPFPSADELAEMTLEQVQEWAKKVPGKPIEFPQRTRKSTYLKAIEERLAEGGDVEEPEAPEDEEPEAPGDEPVDDVEEDEPRRSRKEAALTETPVGELRCVGNCTGCGGPYLLNLGTAVVTEHHARNCGVA